MIDPKLFTVERLIEVLLDEHDNKWRLLAEIIPAYTGPYASSNERPRCVVRLSCGKISDYRYDMFLRHSCGPKQHHFWDIYGEDYISPELALLALAEASPPPMFIDKEVWQAVRDAEVLSRL